MPFPYKNPLNAQLLSAPYSVPRNSVQGTDYSVLGIGGWMEVANLSDLSLTFSGVGLQTLSANTIPINLYIGNGTPFNPSYVNLNSDNFSSGRRRIGMIVYVNETGFAYQYEIDNYESLWNAATGATGTVTSNRYDTQVRNNSEAGQNFIDAWTGSTIEGVSGTTREEAKWRIFHGTDTFVTGGTYFSATSTINLYRNDGVTIPISGITATGGSSSSGFTGGTVSGATIFTGGLTANTISATTYQNLPNTTFTGGTVSGATNFTGGLTANTISATTLSLRNVANTFNGSFTNTNTADRIYTLPDATGTIALTSDLSSYVPYTGASSNVNLGANSLFASTLGVGISSGLSSTAQIRGTSSVTGSTFSVQNSTPVNVFNVLNSGFVGIGSNTPVSLLHIGTGSGTTLGSDTTPVITFNSVNNGIYLDSNRLFFKAGGAFSFGGDATGLLGSQFRINVANTNNLTTPIFVPSRLLSGTTSGLGGTNAGDICLITSGTTRLRINYNGNLGFFGVTPVARQTLGAATAGATYTATEQGMLQRVYDALRNYGLGT
jgi:hypothetical protein